MNKPSRCAPALRAARRLSTAFLGIAALLALAPAQAAVDVGVSVQISQPGVYGRVDIGRFPQPQVIVAQPVLVRPVVQPVQPVYLWVPPGHRNNWRRHCGRYNACGVPVYFVQDRWYDSHVKRARGAKAHIRHRGPDARDYRGRSGDRGPGGARRD